MNQEQELSVVKKHVRSAGLRWTSQRALIVRHALLRHDHFTAEQLLLRCRRSDPHVSRATVYRTLSVLEGAGFVAGLDTGDGSRRFEHVIGHEHHDHMVCNVCGTILEFRDSVLEGRQEVAARRHGFQIESHSLRLYGICRDCRKSGNGKGGR